MPSSLVITKNKYMAHSKQQELSTRDGVIEAAVKWLKQRRWPLLNETALVVLETNPERVSDLIYQIKTGDFS